MDTRHKDKNWNLGESVTWDVAQMAVLMDIRDELKELKQVLSVLSCRNFLQIPFKLDTIALNTKKAKRGQTKKK